MVVFDRTFVQRHLLDAFFAEHGITYQVALQSNFVSLVVQAALDNMGWRPCCARCSNARQASSACRSGQHSR